MNGLILAERTNGNTVPHGMSVISKDRLAKVNVPKEDIRGDGTRNRLLGLSHNAGFDQLPHACCHELFPRSGLRSPAWKMAE